MSKPTDQQCVKWLMQDLVSDYRYGDKSCYPQISALWKNRHTVKLDKYGWPILPEFANERPLEQLVI